MKYADWGRKRAVLKLYRASKNVGKQALGMPEFVQTLPVCVIWGAVDPFIQVEFAEQQKRHFPMAEVHVLQGLGHWPFIDFFEEVRRPLVEFLKRQIDREHETTA
jgi:pimeloyl-ACP methyl ester carboxylesterase